MVSLSPPTISGDTFNQYRYSYLPDKAIFSTISLYFIQAPKLLCSRYAFLCLSFPHPFCLRSTPLPSPPLPPNKCCSPWITRCFWWPFSKLH